jgi:outer membrane protein insertion porin family
MRTRLLELAVGLLFAVFTALLTADTARSAVPQLPDGPVVQGVVFEGLSSFAPEVVQEALGLRTGERLRPMVREQRVAALFRDYGLFVQEIRPVEVEGGVRLEVRILEFEVDLEPRFVGNDSYDEEKLREWSRLTGRSELYIHEADGVVQALVNGYRSEGYAWVEVEWVASDPIPGQRVRDLVFVVREGPRVRCVDVEIVGNESLPDTGFLFWKGGLRQMADPEVEGRGLFSWFGSVFVEEELRADLIAMRQVYRDGGWLDAEVHVDALEYNDERNRVRVRIHVDEGPQYRVGSLELQAVELVEGPDGEPMEQPVDFLFPEEELLESFVLAPGEPYDAARRASDREALRRFYGERGYLDASMFVDPASSGGFRVLKVEEVLDPSKAEVHLTVKVIQGRPRRIRHVEIEGNVHTRDKVIRREIGMLPGEVADLALIQRSLSRVLGTGYFLDPQDPSHRPPRFQFREVDGSPDEVDLEFVVEEGRVVDFQLSGGVASDSGLVGLLSVSHTNFDTGAPPSGLLSMPGEVYRKEALHGNGESVAFDLSPGNQISYWRVAYRHPDLFSDHFNRWGGAFEATSRVRLFTSHREDRTRVRLEGSRLFDQGDLSLRFGAIWQELQLRDLSSGPLPTTLTDSTDPTTFQGLSTRLSWSQLDNRRFPRSGTYAYGEFTVYGGPLGGDQKQVQLDLRGERYFELDVLGDDLDPVLLVEANLGIAAPYGDQDQTHYAERFFLGGSQRMRGFDFRGVGPTVGGVPVGGESMVYLSTELRWPLFTTPIPGTSQRRELFRGGPFIDLGLLDPEAWSFDTEELRASWGFSFALVQPLPIVFNLGWPLREGEGDDLEVFTFSLASR